ncbi:MAG: hypothetical protein K1X42_12020 [Opitutaceae bacterium]|nr:hypothetical protein [Opitutaceae bacterium]
MRRTRRAGVDGLFASTSLMKFTYKQFIIGVLIGWFGAMIVTKYWIQIKDFLHSLF